MNLIIIPGGSIVEEGRMTKRINTKVLEIPANATHRRYEIAVRT
jgi:hypothetical protein